MIETAQLGDLVEVNKDSRLNTLSQLHATTILSISKRRMWNSYSCFVNISIFESIWTEVSYLHYLEHQNLPVRRQSPRRLAAHASSTIRASRQSRL
jgi:hypothetical protein